MLLKVEKWPKIYEKVHFQQYFANFAHYWRLLKHEVCELLSNTRQLTISDNFCIIRTRKNVVQVQSFSIVSSQSTKIDQDVNFFYQFWPILARFGASSSLHSIEDELLEMHTLLKMVYATFFDIIQHKAQWIRAKIVRFPPNGAQN